MPRGLTTNMLTEIAKSGLKPVVFLQAQFVTGTVYLWSGLGTLSWNGQTWTGVGKLGSVSAVQETADNSATNLVISLSGIPSDLVADVITEARTGFPVTLWLGAMDDNFSLIADPYQAFSGRMDVPTMDESGETSTISITVENILVDLNRKRMVWYTDQAQQAEFPGDKGFEYVPQLQDLSINWGVPGAPVTKVSGGGTSGQPPKLALP